MPPRRTPSVRTRLTVLNDGNTESCELVFCEAGSRSVAVSRCDTCRFAGPEACEAARFGAVARKLAALPALRNEVRFPPAVAAALPVGLALMRPIVCLEDTLPWSEAERAPWLEGNRYGVPVVDHAGALVGLLPSTEGALAVRSWAGGGGASVADRAVSAVSVGESESLGRPSR